MRKEKFTVEPVTGELLDGLICSKKLLEVLFPDESARPTMRWLEMQRKAKRIPFIKISRLVFFDADKVRDSLNAQRSAQYGVVK